VAPSKLGMMEACWREDALAWCWFVVVTPKQLLTGPKFECVWLDCSQSARDKTKVPLDLYLAELRIEILGHGYAAKFPKPSGVWNWSTKPFK